MLPLPAFVTLKNIVKRFFFLHVLVFFLSFLIQLKSTTLHCVSLNVYDKHFKRTTPARKNFYDLLGKKFLLIDTVAAPGYATNFTNKSLKFLSQNSSKTIVVCMEFFLFRRQRYITKSIITTTRLERTRATDSCRTCCM